MVDVMVSLVSGMSGQKHTSWPSDNDTIQMEGQHWNVLGSDVKRKDGHTLRRIRKACGLHSLTPVNGQVLARWGRVAWCTHREAVDAGDLHGQDVPSSEDEASQCVLLLLTWNETRGERKADAEKLRYLCINAWHFPHLTGNQCLRVETGALRRSREGHCHLGL